MSEHYDCFGLQIREDDSVFVFISAESGKPFASLDANGFHVYKKRKGMKEENIISLKALKVMIKAVEKK